MCWLPSLLSLQLFASVYNTHDIHTQTFMFIIIIINIIVVVVVIIIIITKSLLKLVTNHSSSAMFKQRYD